MSVNTTSDFTGRKLSQSRRISHCVANWMIGADINEKRIVPKPTRNAHDTCGRPEPLSKTVGSHNFMERNTSPDLHTNMLRNANNSSSQEVEPSTTSSCFNNASSSTAVVNSQVGWLVARLLLDGMPEPLALDCEEKLAYKEGFSNVRDFAECPPTLFHRAYLTSIGITGLGIQQQLLRLHSELHAQHLQSLQYLYLQKR